MRTNNLIIQEQLLYIPLNDFFKGNEEPLPLFARELNNSWKDTRHLNRCEFQNFSSVLLPDECPDIK